MKKQAQKLLAITMAVITVLFSVPLSASAETFSGVCGNGLNWSFDTETGVLELEGESMLHFKNKSEVPWYEYHNEIKEVNIADNVPFIGNYAFADCENLKEIVIPNGISSLGDSAFHNCKSLTSIVIPDSVIAIFFSTFWECTNLESIALGKSLMFIGNTAFGKCTNLKKITVDENNSYYSVDNDSVLYSKDKKTLVRFPLGSEITEYHIPKYVTAIDSFAFADCINIESIFIPDSVTSIGESAFMCCDRLENISIGKGITEIPEFLFWGSIILKNVILPDGITSIGDHAFCATDVRRIHIPSSTQSIGEHGVGDKAYICSDTEDCYAKTYAEENGIKFIICNNEHGNRVDSSVEIAYYDSIVLSYGFSQTFELYVQNLPKNAKLEWSYKGNKISVKPSEDGTECKITSIFYGETEVTVRAVDENGETLIDWDGNEVKDTILVKSKSNLWLKIVMFILDAIGKGDIALELFKKYGI